HCWSQSNTCATKNGACRKGGVVIAIARNGADKNYFFAPGAGFALRKKGRKRAADICHWRPLAHDKVDIVKPSARVIARRHAVAAGPLPYSPRRAGLRLGANRAGTLRALS